MKLFKRHKSVYYTLILSYIILIFCATGLTSFVLFQYFSSNFNRQIEKVNQKMLYQLSNSISSNIVERVESVAKEITTEQAKNMDLLYLFGNPLEGNYIKISLTHKYLLDIVAMYPGIIDSIQVYYKEKEMLISSKMGIVFLQDKPNIAQMYLDWLPEAESMSDNMIWIDTRSIFTDYQSEYKDIMTLVKAYPYSYQGIKAKGYIAINVKQETFYSLIQQEEESLGDVALISPRGQVLSHSSKEKLYDPLNGEDYIKNILSSKEEQGNFIQDVNGIKSMISFVTLKGQPWKIINITPIAEFYKQSETISQVILGISVIVIILGMIYSRLFSMRIYKPIKLIVERRKNLFLGHQGEKEPIQNEYQIINQYIDALAIKVDQLETTLQYNLPLIKFNLVHGLFYNHITSKEVLAERLKILGCDFKHLYFCCVIFQLQEDQTLHMTEENSQFMKYNVIEYIESMGSQDILYMAIPLSENQTGVIINTSYKSDSKIIDQSMQVISYVFSNFMVTGVLAVSRIVSDTLQIHSAFKETLHTLEYQYFMPDCQVLRVEGVKGKETPYEEMPEWIYEKFLEGLNIQKIDRIEEVLTKFQEQCTIRVCNIEYCHQQVLRVMNIFSQYVRGLKINTKEALGVELNEKLKKVKNIIQFKDCLLLMSKKIFEYTREKNANHASDSILKVVEYIKENLHEDLSLQYMADMISLTPPYFSKLFKDETGVNFIDFLTEERMKKARELLTTTNMNIDQITEKVGFSSSSYFIRQFKRKYGLTPGQYKQQISDKKSN